MKINDIIKIRGKMQMRSKPQRCKLVKKHICQMIFDDLRNLLMSTQWWYPNRPPEMLFKKNV